MARTSFRTINDSVDTGTSLSLELNNWRLAILTSFAGAGAPQGVILQDNLIYIDEASRTNRILKHYDGSNHVPLFVLKTGQQAVMFTGGSVDTGFQKDTVNGQMQFLSRGSKKIMFGNERIEIGQGSSPRYTIDCNTSDAIKVPSGTTAQQPSGHDGCIRYDEDLDKFRIRMGGSWKSVATVEDTSTLTAAVTAISPLRPVNNRFIVYTGGSTAALYRLYDESNMSSNSHTGVPTQGSVVDYVSNRKIRDLADVVNLDPTDKTVLAWVNANNRYESRTVVNLLGANSIGAEQLNITS